MAAFCFPRKDNTPNIMNKTKYWIFELLCQLIRAKNDKSAKNNMMLSGLISGAFVIQI